MINTDKLNPVATAAAVIPKSLKPRPVIQGVTQYPCMVRGGQQSSMRALSASLRAYVAERHRHGDDHHTDDVRCRLGDQNGG
jgi:hypothetical protein